MWGEFRVRDEGFVYTKRHRGRQELEKTIEFYLNVFTEFSDKFFSKIKKIAVFEPRHTADTRFVSDYFSA